MSKGKRIVLPALVAGLATVLMVGCGSGTRGVTSATTSGPTGMLVTFGADQPTCDVESFMVTISSWVSEGDLAPDGNLVVSSDQCIYRNQYGRATLVTFTGPVGGTSTDPSLADRSDVFRPLALAAPALPACFSRPPNQTRGSVSKPESVRRGSDSVHRCGRSVFASRRRFGPAAHDGRAPA